jgi:hypothetical protein
MKKNILTLVVISSLSFAANASSPFLVSYDTVDASRVNDVVEASTDKQVTLAESLVQISHCHTIKDNTTKADSLAIDAQQSPSKQKPH